MFNKHYLYKMCWQGEEYHEYNSVNELFFYLGKNVRQINRKTMPKQERKTDSLERYLILAFEVLNDI